MSQPVFISGQQLILAAIFVLIGVLFFWLVGGFAYMKVCWQVRRRKRNKFTSEAEEAAIKRADEVLRRFDQEHRDD